MRHLLFRSDFLVMWKNGLIRKLWLISKFMTSQTGQKIITMYIFPNILRSKSNQAMKFVQFVKYNFKKPFPKGHAKDEARRLVPGLCFFLKKTLHTLFFISIWVN